jgi:integrase
VGRRANGEGSIFRRGDGRWAGFITLPPTTGEQRKKWVTGKTQEVTRLKLEQLRELYRTAPRTHEADVPFGEYAQAWLSFQRPHVKPRTMNIYGGELRNHVLPHLGKLRLIDVTPQHIRVMQYSVVESAGPVAARHARGRARTILQQAFEDGLIPRNPASSVKPVKAPPRKYDVWTEVEVDTFLQVSKGSVFYPMFYLGLTTGLRPGELLALEWPDIGESSVRVRQTVTQPEGGLAIGPPKSPAAVRSVPMPGDARELITSVCKMSRYVFPSTTGTLMSPRNMWERCWLPLLALGDMRYVRPYVLRHTYATMMIAAGIDAATLARYMGHTDPGFTLKTYSHYFERRTPTPALTMQQLLHGNSGR